MHTHAMLLCSLFSTSQFYFHIEPIKLKPTTRIIDRRLTYVQLASHNILFIKNAWKLIHRLSLKDKLHCVQLQAFAEIILVDPWNQKTNIKTYLSVNFRVLKSHSCSTLMTNHKNQPCSCDCQRKAQDFLSWVRVYTWLQHDVTVQTCRWTVTRPLVTDIVNPHLNYSKGVLNWVKIHLRLFAFCPRSVCLRDQYCRARAFEELSRLLFNQRIHRPVYTSFSCAIIVRTEHTNNPITLQCK